MDSQTPSYKIEDFISECASETPRVTVSHDAEQEAMNSFNLPTAKDLRAFIGNGGINTHKFKNSLPLRKNLAGNKGKMVDAYHFRDGRKIGYIAFIFNDERKKWHIKSFKEEPEQASIALRKMLGEK